MNKEFVKGVRFAAEVADAYNGSTTHPYKLGDCILAKLNVLPKGKRARVNSQRRKTIKLLDGRTLDLVTIEWALGEVMRLPITERTLELSDRMSFLIKMKNKRSKK